MTHGTAEEGASLVVRSEGPGETVALGERLGRALRRAHAAGAVVTLSGPLGAGKTTFVQGLARGLKAAGRVHSPTFVLIHQHRGDVPLFHVDLYRLEAHHVDGLGLDELVEGPGVTAIEWAEHAGGSLPDEHLGIRFAYGAGDAERVLRITAHGAKYTAVLEALR